MYFVCNGWKFNYVKVRVASAYFLLGSILTRDTVHTDREKVSTKASYYTDKQFKKKDQVLICSNLSCKSFPHLCIHSQYK